MVEQDYYDLLGVQRGADEAAIKAAYRRLAKECHPDKNADASAAAAFKRLVEAYSVLSDAKNRALYDGRPYEPEPASRSRGSGPPPSTHPAPTTPAPTADPQTSGSPPLCGGTTSQASTQYAVSGAGDGESGVEAGVRGCLGGDCGG